jgi:hypothetical protein
LRLPVLAAAAVLAMALAVLVVKPWLTGGEDSVPGQVAAPPPSEATTDPGPHPTVSGGGRVRCMGELANAVAARPPETLKAGRYTTVHSRWWGEDASYSEKQGSTQTMVTYESRLWRATDGSGRLDVIAIPGEPSREEGSSTYTPGGLAGVLREPITTSPDVLAAQLQVHSPPQMGPQWVLHAVADVYQQGHATPQPVRVALLRVLANQTSGLECEGTTVDRIGRRGIAVAVNSNSDKARDRLIFDPVDGRLLADEQVILRNPPALSGPTPRTISYLLFLETGQVDHLPPAWPRG